MQPRLQCAIVAATIAASTGAIHAQCDYDILTPDPWTLSDFHTYAQPVVDLHGQWLARSTRYDHPETTNHPDEAAGVIIFQRLGDDWTHTQTLRDPGVDTNTNSTFGHKLDLHEQRLAVLAHDPGHGVVHIYDCAEDVWKLTATIPIGDTIDGNGDGSHMDLVVNGDELFVRVRTEHNVSHVQVFNETAPGRWELAQEIFPPSFLEAEYFGQSMSLHGNQLIIAAGRPVRQAAWKRQGGQWILDSKVVVDGEFPIIYNATSKLIDNTLVTYGTTTLIGENSDRVWIFQRSGDAWSMETVDVPHTLGGDIEDIGRKSRGLDFDGTTIAVARSGGQSHRVDRGAMYIIRNINDTWTVDGGIRPGSKFEIEGMAPTMIVSGFGSDLRLDDDSVLVTAQRTRSHWYGATQPCILRYDLNADAGADLDGNGICDHLDILRGAEDRNGNLIADEVEIAFGLASDCNGNALVDDVEYDCDGDGIPDSCEQDCNGNGIPDDCENDYDIGNQLTEPFMQWGVTGTWSDQLWLRRIIVEPGKEIVNEITCHRGAYIGEPIFSLVVYRDDTPDGDPTDADLILRQDINLNDAPPASGLRVAIPELELGPWGTHIYLGLFVRNARYDQMYIRSYGLFNLEDERDTWIYLSNEEALHLNFLEEAEHAIVSPLPTPLIEMHRGPHGLCCTDSDLNGDNITDVHDLLAVISAWGPCNGCPEDIDHDGDVNINDLLTILSNWGQCTN